MSLKKDKAALWQEMADMTFAKCREHCHDLGCCCSQEYCDMAAEIMEKAGAPVPPMPFSDKDGRCTIPPHFRPLCSLHQCKISGLGLDLKDKKWTDKYFKLREKLEEVGYGT